MIKPKIYHANLSQDTSYTFEFDMNTTCFLAKNLTDGNLKVSFGDYIDDNSYSLIPKETAEQIFVSSVNNEEGKTDKITVISSGSGVVEIRLLDF